MSESSQPRSPSSMDDVEDEQVLEDPEAELDGPVWAVGGAGAHRRVHVDEECQRIKNSTRLWEHEPSEVMPGWVRCPFCFPDLEPNDRRHAEGRGHLESLVAAAEAENGVDLDYNGRETSATIRGDIRELAGADPSSVATGRFSLPTLQAIWELAFDARLDPSLGVSDLRHRTVDLLEDVPSRPEVTHNPLDREELLALRARVRERAEHVAMTDGGRVLPDREDCSECGERPATIEGLCRKCHREHQDAMADGGLRAFPQLSAWPYAAVVHGVDGPHGRCLALTGSGKPCTNSGHGGPFCGLHSDVDDPDVIEGAHQWARIEDDDAVIAVCVNCQQVWRHGSPGIAVDCPECAADAGERCYDEGSMVKSLHLPHQTRREAAQELLDDYAPCKAWPLADDEPDLATDGGGEPVDPADLEEGDEIVVQEAGIVRSRGTVIEVIEASDGYIVSLEDEGDDRVNFWDNPHREFIRVDDGPDVAPDGGLEEMPVPSQDPCRNCGQVLTPDWNFCPNCGAEVPSVEAIGDGGADASYRPECQTCDWVGDVEATPDEAGAAAREHIDDVGTAAEPHVTRIMQLVTDGGVKRFGPVTLSQTDADEGARLYIPSDVLEESGLTRDSSVLLQPYQNGIHVIDAKEAVFGDDEDLASDDGHRELPSGSTDLEAGSRLIRESDWSVWRVVGHDDYDDLPIIVKVEDGYGVGPDGDVDVMPDGGAPFAIEPFANDEQLGATADVGAEHPLLLVAPRDIDEGTLVDATREVLKELRHAAYVMPEQLEEHRPAVLADEDSPHKYDPSAIRGETVTDGGPTDV